MERVRAVLDELAGRLLDSGRTPGLVVAATDAGGAILEAHYGWADIAARVRPGPDTLFQIGSISKVATAILAVRLWDEGLLDLDRPVRGYLEWLPEEPYGRITAHQLLSHTSGLGSGSDISPPSPYLALSACGAPVAEPGGFHYSNAGFQVLGLLVEEIAGTPYPRLLAERILGPLGMRRSGVITSMIRPRLATGYTPSPDDLPYAAGDGLAPAPFFEYTAGDGGLACTIGDLAAFARLLVNHGEGALSGRGFERLTTPVADTGDGESICYGVFAGGRYGYPDLNHGGSMVGYESMLCVDPETGFGTVTMSNGVGNSTPIARALLDALRENHRGEAPTAPSPRPPKLDEYVREYAGHRVELATGKLRLDDAELIHIRDDVFARKGSPFTVRFGRRDGEVVNLSHGPHHWTTDDDTAEEYPEKWDGYCGQYRAHQPFEPTFHVFVRNGSLFQAWPSGREDELVPMDGPAAFRVDGRRDVLTFDTPAGPRFLRAVLSGCPFYRALTPWPPPGGA